MRGILAYFRASAATSISFLTARVSPQTVAFFTNLAMASTEAKSPGLEIGKPASIMSTPNWSSRSAMTNFFSVASLQPGTCSPSLRVVSKIFTCSLDINAVLLYENSISGGFLVLKS